MSLLARSLPASGTLLLKRGALAASVLRHSTSRQAQQQASLTFQQVLHSSRAVSSLASPCLPSRWTPAATTCSSPLFSAPSSAAAHFSTGQASGGAGSPPSASSPAPSHRPQEKRAAAGLHKFVRPKAGSAGSLPRKFRPSGAAQALSMASERSHHTKDGAFQNPPEWGSYKEYGPSDYMLRVAPNARKLDTYALPTVAPDWSAFAEVSGAAGGAGAAAGGAVGGGRDPLKAMWLGHAGFLVQGHGYNFLTDPVFSKRCAPVQWFGPARYTPPPCTVEDIPSSVPIHAVLISHNHYDHVDSGSVTALLEKEKRDLAEAQKGSAAGSGPGFAGTLWVCPLRVAPLLRSCGVPEDKIVELDWWESFTPGTATGAAAGTGVAAGAGAVLRQPTLSPLAAEGQKLYEAFSPAEGEAEGEEGQAESQAAAGAASAASSSSSPAAPDAATLAATRLLSSAPFTVVAVPAQHQSARTPFDRNQTLWCGYVVLTRDVTSTAAAAASSAGAGAAGTASASGHPNPMLAGTSRFYFTGDTGYKAVERGTAQEIPLSPEEAALTPCPAFAEVGSKFGPVDLSALPIGAYSPRWFMSSFHTSPEDAVEIHSDVQSRRSIGMHWGVFPLTDEPIEEPHLRLAKARAAKGLGEQDFMAVWPGAVVSAARGVLQEDHLVRKPVDPVAAAGGPDAYAELLKAEAAEAATKAGRKKQGE